MMQNQPERGNAKSKAAVSNFHGDKVWSFSSVWYPDSHAAYFTDCKNIFCKEEIVWKKC